MQRRYVYTCTQLAANTIRCDAFHICASQSPTTKFACCRRPQHTSGRCAAGVGDPLRPLLPAGPRPPVSIMKLHQIKQTRDRRDGLGRWFSHVPLRANDGCFSDYIGRCSIPLERTRERNLRRSPLHESAPRMFTPVSGRVLHRTVFLPLTKVQKPAPLHPFYRYSLSLSMR